MSDPTEYFYRDTAEIYEISSDGGYDPVGEKRLIKTISCDIQPYGGGLEAMERGFYGQGKIKLFCRPDNEIVRGSYVKHDGEFYIVTDVQKWSMGYEVIAEWRDLS